MYFKEKSQNPVSSCNQKTECIILKGEIVIRMGTKDGKLQWHPAFAAALHIEFEEELDEIDIREEHLLSKKMCIRDRLRTVF